MNWLYDGQMSDTVRFVMVTGSLPTGERQRTETRRLILDADLDAAELTRIFMTSVFGFLIFENEPASARRFAAHRMLDLLVGGARA